VREEAGLAPESEEEGEEKLPARGIEPRLTGAGESAVGRELGTAAMAG